MAVVAAILKMKGMRYLIIGLLGVAQFACSSKSAEKKETSHEESVKLEQYMVSGQELYNIHCSSCHQVGGEGLAKLFPPLNKSDYLDEHMADVPCIIKKGLSGEIVVNGEVYNQPMPGLPHLSALEIAEITTYITNSWGRSNGLVPVKEVEKILEGCKDN